MPALAPGPILKVLRATVGVVVFLAGVLMLFLPGPGLLFMALGLGLVSPPLARRFRVWLRSKVDYKQQRPPT